VCALTFNTSGVLYAEHSEIESIARPKLESLLPNKEHESIDCFYYALKIYTREKFPEHWAMLQHNLGLAYFDRIQGERWENLQKSIECFNKSLEVFTQDKFPKKWQINQEDLSQSLETYEVEKQNSIRDIFEIGSHQQSRKSTP
jgi:tetratricopeptide (TPR) repeat protein